ncbi:MAG: translation elongation factor Ts [Phycisphaeraceae bacterium]
MAVSAKDVMALRGRTGLGMMECKIALEATNGDMDAAIAKLREELGAKMSLRSDRAASEGWIAAATQDGAVAMIALVSETDFAAKSEKFQNAAAESARIALKEPAGEIPKAPAAVQTLVDDLRITIKENISYGKGIKLEAPKVGSYVHHTGKVGVVIAGEGDLSEDLLKGLCQHLVAADGKGQWASPLSVDSTGLPADKLAEAKAAAVAEAQASGKPANIAEKIAEGKVRKWTDDHTLMGQIYIREMDAKKPVRDYIPKGAKITAFRRFDL